MKFCIFLTAILLVSVTQQAAALAAEKAETVLANMKEAAGGNAWDGLRTARIQASVTTSGLQGNAGTWEDLLSGRHVTVYQLGPISGADGFDGEITWSKDTSGQVLKQEGEGARQGTINEAYRVCRAFWYPGRWKGEIELAEQREEDSRRFQVLRIKPEGGRPFDVWVDAETWLIDRTVEETGVETRTTFFSDYRDVDGVRYPFASRSTNGESRYDFIAEIEDVTFNEPLEEKLFEMPAPPPPDFVFDEGTSQTTIPFRLINNHIYVEVELNGKGPFLVLCDTGGANIVTPTLAGELGLEPVGNIQGRGAGESSEDVSVVEIGSLRVGDVTLENQLFFVFPLESFQTIEGIPQSGLIGYEVFKRFVVEIDYEKNLLTLTRPEAFSYTGDGTIVPFQFDGRTPQVKGELDGITGMFTIDTGSRASLTLHGPFVEKHDLMTRLSPEVEGVTGWGVGGPVRASVARARLLRLGSVEFERPVTEMSLQTAGAFTDTYVAGNVGAGILQRYNIIFDYGKQQMIFEPNGNSARKDVFDRSGMWMNLKGMDFEIFDVIENGPAAAAGLKVGDVITGIDGKDSSQMSLPELRLRFRTDPPGTRVRLQVTRDGSAYEKTLVLEDLV